MPKKLTEAKLTDLTPDNTNANVGSARGTAMLERSLQEYGAGRSIVIDKNGKVIAGNKTLESAVGIGIEDALVVHTTGDQLVVVQRDDLDLETDVKALELGVADNRSSEVNLTWAVDVLQKIEDQGAKLDLFFTTQETEELVQKALAFKPDMEPNIGVTMVSPEQVESEGNRLAGQFAAASESSARAAFEAVCPSCGHEFEFRATTTIK